MYILFGKKGSGKKDFAINRLGINENEIIDFPSLLKTRIIDIVNPIKIILVNNIFDDQLINGIINLFSEAQTIFFTHGTNPGDKGVWDADIIFDRREDIEKWKTQS